MNSDFLVHDHGLLRLLHFNSVPSSLLITFLLLQSARKKKRSKQANEEYAQKQEEVAGAILRCLKGTRASHHIHFSYFSIRAWRFAARGSYGFLFFNHGFPEHKKRKESEKKKKGERKAKEKEMSCLPVALGTSSSMTSSKSRCFLLFSCFCCILDATLCSYSSSITFISAAKNHGKEERKNEEQEQEKTEKRYFQRGSW